jgi:hypothetical protein
MLSYRTFSFFDGFEVAKGGTVRSRDPISITRSPGYEYVISCFESILEADSLRSLLGAR